MRGLVYLNAVIRLYSLNFLEKSTKFGFLLL